MAQSAYNRALDLLSARPYTVRDLKRKLARKEVPADEIDAVLDRLTGAGLLDDEKYALAFARSKLMSAGSSKRRIRQELGRKGVSAEMSDIAVAQVVADEELDTRALVERVARKKLASLGDLEPLVLRRRMYGFLARRGYDLDEIQAVMKGLGV